LPIPQNQAVPLLHVLLAIFKTKTAKTTDTSICISLSVKEDSRLATSTFMVLKGKLAFPGENMVRPTGLEPATF
ncbi:unnamed protein product, partial [marine sediment metagenome]